MERQQAKPVCLDIISGLAVLAAFVVVVFLTPLEVVMGAVQKVFYFHVSAAWVGMLGFLAAAVCAGFYLKTRNIKWDIRSEAGVEIGLVFTTIGIVSGSIWARPIWNTWWTWDPRLTTSAIMVLIYLAYLMLRHSLDEPGRRARYSAIYALLGFVSVPLTFLSIRLFRTIHPVILSGETGFNMDAAMLRTFYVSLIAFTILFVDLFWHRINLGELEEEAERTTAIQQEE